MPIPLIAAAIGLGGTLISSHAASSAQKNAQKAAQTDPLAVAQRQQIDQQSAYGKQMGGYADQLFPQYLSGVGDLSKYFKTILGDSNDAALGAIAPQVRARKNQTAAALYSLDYAPRGGGRGAAMGQLYDTEGADILDMLGGARDTARAGYASLVGDVGSRADDLMHGAAGVSGSSASLLGAMLSNQQQQKQIAGQNAAASAGSIGSALGPLIIEILRSQRGGSSSSPTPSVGTGGKG